MDRFDLPGGGDGAGEQWSFHPGWFGGIRDEILSTCIGIISHFEGSLVTNQYNGHNGNVFVFPGLYTP